MGGEGGVRINQTNYPWICHWDARLFHLLCSLPPLQYMVDTKYNEKTVSIYMSNFTEGSKVNNYTLMVIKDTGVSSTYT